MQSSGTPRSLATRTTTACRACHLRKTKCDARTPICGQCLRRGGQCEPHLRTRRAGLSTDDERRLRQRVAWLESELAQAHGLPPDEVRKTKTGESFVPHIPESPMECFSLPVAEYTQPLGDRQQEEQPPGQGDAVEKEVGDIAANVAVLSLNATGEMRFMGGPSGVLFSRLIASTVKKYLYTTNLEQRKEPQPSFLFPNIHHTTQDVLDSFHNSQPGNTHAIPAIETAKGYLTTYIQWVHLTYPIFHKITLDSLVCSVYEDSTTLSPAQWTIFYLVMAIGEWNQRHLSDTSPPQGTSAAELFSCAMTWFDRVLPLDGMEGLQIVLLLAIYSSYRPTGSSQWHLAGIAMRLCIDMGLHRHNPDWRFSPDEWDIRQRVFWVTYAIDRTVCFNLGRPVTLSDDHIDAPFPNTECQSQSPEPSIALALHHIRLRIIQTRIINEVYTLGKSSTEDTDHDRGQILASIQQQLDEWRSQLSQIYSSHQTPHSFKWYERLYYTTTASLHRATPLFPRPTEDSIRQCHEASANAVRTYYSLHRSNEMEQSWILLSGCFLAGITMLYSLWSSDVLAKGVRLEEVTETCRMCSNVLAVLSAKWKASDEFSDTFESLTNITTKRLVEQLQQRYRGDPLYASPPGMFPFDQGMVLDSLSWPQDLNFHTALTNPNCITEVFDDLLRAQEGIWNT